MEITDEHVLAAYVDGCDLDEVAPILRPRLHSFAASGSWPTDQVLVIDLKQPPDPDAPDFLPQWDLGLNLGLDHINRARKWFDGVDTLVRFLKDQCTETGREFVLFLCYKSQPSRQEHLTFIDGKAVDLKWLESAIRRLVATGKKG